MCHFFAYTWDVLTMAARVGPRSGGKEEDAEKSEKKEAVKERRGWRQLLSPDGTAMRITIKRQTCSRIHTQA